MHRIEIWFLTLKSYICIFFLHHFSFIFIKLNHAHSFKMSDNSIGHIKKIRNNLSPSFAHFLLSRGNHFLNFLLYILAFTLCVWKWHFYIAINWLPKKILSHLFITHTNTLATSPSSQQIIAVSVNTLLILLSYFASQMFYPLMLHFLICIF